MCEPAARVMKGEDPPRANMSQHVEWVEVTTQTVPHVPRETMCVCVCVCALDLSSNWTFNPPPESEPAPHPFPTVKSRSAVGGHTARR